MAKRIIIPGEAATAAAEAAQGFEPYGGKTPPAGTYRVRVSSAKYNEENRNGDPYITVGLRVTHDVDEPKSRFNGYFRTSNLTLTESQAPYNKQFCEAVGISAKALHRPMVEDDGTITTFGATPVDGLRARVGFTNGSYNGRRQLNPRSFFPDKEDDADVQDVDDDDAEVEYSDADAPDEYDTDTYTGEDDGDEYAAEPDEGDEETADEGDEGDGEDNFDDNDAEPEPVKAAPRKAVKAPPARPAAKAAAKKAPAKAARKPF